MAIKKRLFIIVLCILLAIFASACTINNNTVSTDETAPVPSEPAFTPPNGASESDDDFYGGDDWMTPATVTIDGRSIPTDVTFLDLSDLYTPLTDFTILESFTCLTTLILHNTLIIDLTPLSSLTSLESLDLSYTQVSDITPLGTLMNLTSLDLGWEKTIAYNYHAVKTNKGLTILFAETDIQYAPPVWPEEPGEQQKQMYLNTSTTG